MAKGNFEGLYTFIEVARIYGMDDSSLRKQVARNKFIIGKDIKKMGRTWIITEQAMVRNFGSLKFKEYKEKQIQKNKLKKLTAKSASQGTRSSRKMQSMNQKEENIKDSWVSGEIKGLELRSFDFNINDNKQG